MMINNPDTVKKTMPVLYLPHGGGPMPLLGEPRHKGIINFLKTVPAKLSSPKAIVIISAHWEADVVSVTSSPNPSLYFDYGGFPAECYQYQYPASGDIKLATKIVNLLSENNIESKLEGQRGFDHGAFVPLMLMYPKADIPVVQLSLARSLDPQKHIAMGEALSSLREEGVLIIGSGMSFDNLRGSYEHSVIFDDWLSKTLIDLPVAEANDRLVQWESAPSARASHPHEAHLLPVHVCFGAATKATKVAEKIFTETFFKFRISAFLWE